MATNNHTTTFWHFLENYSIEIPIIQRDYAQGRIGKESLRKNFLNDLKEALEETLDKSKLHEKMKLDFIYGSTENGKLYPLDGQQRLTTLWLLHWYIALNAGKNIFEEASARLKKFSYETRVSSRNFCEELCEPKNFEKFNCSKDIVDFITNQTWFYSAWKQDPTIQSMLRMLGGSKGKNDLSDGIEKVFGCCNCISNKENRFEQYYHSLIGEDCPIVFYYLPKDFGNSDDLYIKMNARGEQLTSFENFKADLIGYIEKKAEKDKNWKTLRNPNDGIPIKFDKDWTDIFWKHKSEDYKIDDIYFAFLNRFFLNELICLKDEKKKEGEKTELKYKFTADYLEKENKTFKYLYGNKGNDSKLQYNDLGIYQYSSDDIPFQLFDSLQKTLNKYNDKRINDYFPKWVSKSEFNSKDKFEFIPKYNEEGITILGQKERIVFLAVCRYLEKCSDDFDDKRFEQWMRVVWNIVENSGIETISAMIGAMRLINELSEHSHTIYEFLSDSNSIIESDFAKDQVEEEIDKAKQILNGALRTDAKTREDAIKEAEKYAFFKGAIRFLFTDGERNINWHDFDTKLENARKYFDENGVKDGETPDKLYKTNSLLIKSLLANGDWNNIWWNFGFSNDAVRWRSILTSDKWVEAVDEIMSSDMTLEKTKFYVNKTKNSFVNNIIDDELMDYVCNIMSGAWIRSTYHGYHAIWQSGYPSSQIVLNPILAQLKYDGRIDYSEDNRIKNCRYYRCVDKNVDFKYNNHFFRWYGYPNYDDKGVLDVYLMEKKENGELDYWPRKNELPEETTENKNWFCFRVFENTTPESFTEMLDCLIHQAEADEQSQPCYDDCQNKINGCLYENTEH